MRDTTQVIILNALLDKYERSAFFVQSKQPTRRILLHLYNKGESDFPYYDIEQSERRVCVNNAVLYLAEMRLISYKWADGERGHIIGTVWLVLDNISDAYHAVGREPKGDVVNKIRTEVERVRSQARSAWSINFLSDVLTSLYKKRNATGLLPADNEERTLLLGAISAIDQLDGIEYTERLFSLRTFGDSKTFERLIKSRIIGILRRYQDNDDDDTSEDILGRVGIFKYPEQFEFCGNICIVLNNRQIDFGCLPSGGVIYSSDLSLGTITIAPSVNSIITIENRANYIEYIRKSKVETEVTVYHGGQYSPRKRLFFRELARAMPECCKWLHWSDIDFGGFVMLSRLRKDIDPEIKPYRMNDNELEQYRAFTTPINHHYAEKLERIKDNPELSDCRKCIEYMLKNRLRLEQEIMLSDF